MERSKQEIIEQISSIIDESINPAVAGHGGMIELKDFDVESGRVLVLLQGDVQVVQAVQLHLKWV